MKTNDTLVLRFMCWILVNLALLASPPVSSPSWLREVTWLLVVIDGCLTLVMFFIVCLYCTPEYENCVIALREFVSDVEAVGIDYVEDDWPDLIPTYERAKAALAEHIP